VTTVGIMLTYFLREQHDDQLQKLMSNYSVAFFSGLSFILGALFSGFSGYAGIWVSVRANVRVASAARNCYNNAIQIAFQGGYFAAVINVALAVLGYVNKFK
jgi:Na+/H+-translocating membrane pyrophosphatase